MDVRNAKFCEIFHFLSFQIICFTFVIIFVLFAFLRQRVKTVFTASLWLRILIKHPRAQASLRQSLFSLNTQKIWKKFLFLVSNEYFPNSWDQKTHNLVYPDMTSSKREIIRDLTLINLNSLTLFPSTLLHIRANLAGHIDTAAGCVNVHGAEGIRVIQIGMNVPPNLMLEKMLITLVSL